MTTSRFYLATGGWQCHSESRLYDLYHAADILKLFWVSFMNWCVCIHSRKSIDKKGNFISSQRKFAVAGKLVLIQNFPNFHFHVADIHCHSDIKGMLTKDAMFNMPAPLIRCTKNEQRICALIFVVKGRENQWNLRNDSSKLSCVSARERLTNEWKDSQRDTLFLLQMGDTIVHRL